MQERWCYKCGETKPLTEDYWYYVSSKYRTFKTICKKCCNEQSKISHQQKRDRLKGKK